MLVTIESLLRTSPQLIQSVDNIKKGNKTRLIEWRPDQQMSFYELKEACCNSPVLAYVDYKQPFILHTDSFLDGLGAILYQKDGEGKIRVIAYASKCLTKSERNYPAHKLEFLALKWAVTDKFKEYLYGTSSFEVFTDNNPLTYVLITAKLDATTQRWVAALTLCILKSTIDQGNITLMPIL